MPLTTAQATPQTPDQIFADLHGAAVQAAGARLFTVTVQDVAAGVVRRAYTSHPDDYPASGTKPLQTDRWSAQVLGRGEPFVANDTAGFADVFPDHAQINALGCAAVINIPIIEEGVVLGTVNILDVAGHFTPERVAVFNGLMAERHDLIVAAMRATPMGEGI